MPALLESGDFAPKGKARRHGSTWRDFANAPKCIACAHVALDQQGVHCTVGNWELSNPTSMKGEARGCSHFDRVHCPDDASLEARRALVRAIKKAVGK